MGIRVPFASKTSLMFENAIAAISRIDPLLSRAQPGRDRLDAPTDFRRNPTVLEQQRRVGIRGRPTRVGEGREVRLRAVEVR